MVTVSKIFDCSIEKVWSALSIESELKMWYFPVENYEFEIGKEFTFYESCESKTYLHKCKFLQIIPNKLIEYTWEHPTHSTGTSVVKWEFEAMADKCKITLTHSGIETFADAGENFSEANFEMGWKAIVGNLLRNYLYGIEKLTYEIEINATKDKVWNIMWDKKSYSDWTEPFCAGAFYEGEMKQGNRIHFLAPSYEGMYSDVQFCKENEVMIFKHIGMLKDKIELPLDAESEKWTGCFETYKLSTINNKTILKVEVDVVADYKTYMQKSFPLAIQKLKEMAEK